MLITNIYVSYHDINLKELYYIINRCPLFTNAVHYKDYCSFWKKSLQLDLKEKGICDNDRKTITMNNKYVDQILKWNLPGNWQADNTTKGAVGVRDQS